MNIQESKKIVRDLLTMEMELIEFIEECLKEIFPNADEQSQAIHLFRDNLERIEDWGCIQSLIGMKNRICIDGKYPYRKEEKEGSVL